MLQVVFEGNQETTFIRFNVLKNINMFKDIKMFSIKYICLKRKEPTFWSSEGCLKGSLEQTHKSMYTPRTCKNRCDMNISYVDNDFDFGSRNQLRHLW